MSKSTEPHSEFVMTISAYGITAKEADALFDRVADAAHAQDEQVTCSSTYEKRTG